jgi:hypothetical protein
MAMERWCVGARYRCIADALIQDAGDDSIASFSALFSMAHWIALRPRDVML